MPLNSRVRLGVIRDGKAGDVVTTLSAPKLASVNGSELDARLSGAVFRDLSQSQRSQGMFGAAVAAVQPGSRAALAGLTTRDIIVGVGNQRIPSVSVLRGLASVRLRQLVLIVAQADGSNRYVVVN